MPFRTATDYESYLARLRAFPALVAQEIRLMRDGLESGFSLSRSVLAGLDQTAQSHVVADPEQSVFFAPFRMLPAAVPDADRVRLADAGRRAIETAVVPAYRSLAEFLRGDYAARARGSARPEIGRAHV